jgi:hypothetical protein
MANKTCENCKYWSEMLAFIKPPEPMNAMCLNQESPHKHTYTTEIHVCDKWDENIDGAVDDPEKG